MLQINDKVRIVRSDENNLQIEELRTVTSKKLGSHEEWCWCGYYSTLKSALLGVLSKQLFDCIEEETNLIDVINAITKAQDEIVKACENLKIKRGN